jgi:puromycin-sensitive aminopeptidase
MFDVLTYEKGASVLRMLEQDLGPQVFREGVRGYLRAHAYDNADTKDLWIALGEAADRPVPVVMDGWIFAPGYPLLTVGLDQSGQILISQQRFTYLGRGDLPEAVTQAVSGAPVALAHCIESAMGTPSNGYREQRWQVPVQLAIMTRGRREVRRVLLTDSAARVELPADFGAVLVNEGGHGFYRVRYGPDLLARLIKLLPGGLPAIERFNLINDAWALALAGQMPITEYLDLTAHFAADRDKNVWAVLVESFHFLNRVIEPSERPALEAFVRSRVGPAVAMLGWHPKPGEDELARQLRGDLIRALGTIGNDRAIQTEAGELYTAAATKPAAVDANVLPALIAILAHTGDAARYDEFLQRFRAAGTPQEERRYLYALAAFQPEPLLQDTLARAISGEIRTQDAPFIVRLLLLSVYGRGITWRFIKANWDTMDRLFPRQGLRRMCEGVIGLATPEWERDVHRLFDERKIELGGKTLAQYLEQLRIAVAFRMRTAAELRPYLARVGARNSRATV